MSQDFRETKLFKNLLKTTQQFMSGKGYVPQSESELIARLHLPPQHIPLFKKVLSHMVKTKTIELAKGRYAPRRAPNSVAKGTLHLHPKGFGFVQLEDVSISADDIFIPKHLTRNAVHGDTVEVLINTERQSEKGPEGKIINILSRNRTHVAGIIKTIEKDGTAIGFVPMLGIGHRVVVEKSAIRELALGDRIVMEVIDWGSKETETICQLSQYIGNISDPSCDIKAAIAEYEIRSTFPEDVVKEAEKIGSRVSTKDIKQREDLRHMECFTIDPDTAKDFDDAISLTKDKEGFYHLGVHIADVSHYVQPGSQLDKEARARCNSTYFPGTCVPMLPAALSENLCSLRADVNRLTASIIMKFDSEGSLVDYRITRSVIKSAKRFSYREAKLVLDGKAKSPHAPTLHLMVEMCGLLKKKRYERGSIEFALPDFVVIVDEQGVPQKIDHVSYDITHQMVEEFMLKANEMVAIHLTNLGKGLTYRIHDEPAEDNLKDFASLARTFGFELSSKPTPVQLQELFDAALETPYGQYLATSYIRSMRLAVYSADNIGHYGLGLSHYCHFTSPIRRYIDLVVHRILFGEEEERPNLDAIAKHCSERERISSKAENSVVQLKKLRLLKKYYEEEPYRSYEAVVTRVKPFGFFFEAIDFLLEGFLHVSELEDDYFVYEESLVRLRGRHSGKIYSSGERIQIILRNIDFITLTTSWYLVPEFEREVKPKQGQKKISKKIPVKSKAEKKAPAKKPVKPEAKKKRLAKKPVKEKAKPAKAKKSTKKPTPKPKKAKNKTKK